MDDEIADDQMRDSSPVELPAGLSVAVIDAREADRRNATQERGINYLAIPFQSNDFGLLGVPCRCRCHSQCYKEEGTSSSKDEILYETEWRWEQSLDSEYTHLTKSNLDVMFHKEFSNGTAAIRGSMPLRADQHYWEIKMTTSVYGTDMMIGFGTELVDLRAFSTKFASLLGADGESWGLSYTGSIMHNGVKRSLCKGFGQGVTIGIHMDMWLGRMSVFRNGKFVGVGFSKGIRGKEIYPMACSTAARTGMRIVRSSSFPTSLQFMCCQVLRNAVPAEKDVSDAIQLAPGLRQFLVNNLDWLLRPYSPHQVSETVGKIRKRGLKCVQEVLCDETKVGSDSKKPRTKQLVDSSKDFDDGSTL